MFGLLGLLVGRLPSCAEDNDSKMLALRGADGSGTVSKGFMFGLATCFGGGGGGGSEGWLWGWKGCGFTACCAGL